MKIYSALKHLGDKIGLDQRTIKANIGKSIIEIKRINKHGKEETAGYIDINSVISFILSKLKGKK